MDHRSSSIFWTLWRKQCIYRMLRIDPRFLDRPASIPLHIAIILLWNNLLKNLSETNFNSEFMALAQDSSVGVATSYGLDGQGIECRVDAFFHNSPDRTWGPPVPYTMGTGSFPGGNLEGRNVDHTNHRQGWRKIRARPLSSLSDLMAGYRVNFIFFLSLI